MARSADNDATGGKRQRRALLRAPLAGACVAAFLSANAANAHVEEKCYNGEAEISQLRAELKAEGQAPIYVGNQQNIGRDGQIFYSNSNGSRGYVAAFNSSLKIGAKPDGTAEFSFVAKPTKICVGITMANIKTFPTSGPGNDRIPSEALTGIDPKISQAALANDTFGGAAVQDLSIRKRYSAGWRVAIVADTIVPEAGGERFGPRLVFGYRPNDVPMRQGNLSFVDGEGVTRTMATTSDTRQTDFATYLNRNTQVVKPTSEPK